MSYQSVVLGLVLRFVRKTLFSQTEPEKLRAIVARSVRRLPPAPADVAIREHNIRGTDAYWFEPRNARPHKVILYLHGGGYIFCSARDTHRDLIVRLAKAAECKVLAIDYRLAPEHPFPAALDDAVSAYRWLAEIGYAPRNIAVAGDSAGGGLSFSLMLRLRELGIELPAALVAISPWTDLAITGASIVENARRDPLIPAEGLAQGAAYYVGTDDPKNPLISPLYGDVAHLPPALIQVGSEEVLLDDARRMAAKLKQAGVPIVMEEWHKMPHVWHSFATFLPEARAAIDHIGLFLRGHMYGD